MNMKKMLLTLITLAALTTAVYAYSPYDGEDIRGDVKVCYYLDGSSITVDVGDSCPMSN